MAITNQNLTCRIVTVRGWTSAIADAAPGLITGNWARWAPIPANFREGWAMFVAGTGISFGGFLSFVEGTQTMRVDLMITPDGAKFFLNVPGGTTVGYGFQVTWQ